MEPPKKKFVMLQSVRDFMRGQPGDVKQELNGLIWMLEQNGALSAPYAEKMSDTDLFVLRVIQAGNIRVFYVYGTNDFVYGIHGYVKKTEEAPQHEKEHAIKIMKKLVQGGYVK